MRALLFSVKIALEHFNDRLGLELVHALIESTTMRFSDDL